MRKKPDIPVKTCEMCKKEYKPNSFTQKFCHDCGKIADKERKRKHYIKTHPNAYIEKPPEFCVVCGKKKSASYNGLPYCNKHWLRLYLHGTTEPIGRKPKNTYEIRNNGVAYCKTAKGETFLLDAEDVERCLRHSWCFDLRGYLVSRLSKNDKNTITLHRFVLNMKAGDGLSVDHINGDRADNRKSNLRTCTQAENGRNLKRKKNNKTGYPGVEITKAGTYRATLMIDGKSKGLGTYKTFEEAKAARINGEFVYYGEFSPAYSRGNV